MGLRRPQPSLADLLAWPAIPKVRPSCSGLPLQEFDERHDDSLELSPNLNLVSWAELPRARGPPIPGGGLQIYGAAVSPPDNIEHSCRKQREIVNAVWGRRGHLGLQDKDASDCTFLLNIGPERDILLFPILGDSAETLWAPRDNMQDGGPSLQKFGAWGGGQHLWQATSFINLQVKGDR